MKKTFLILQNNFNNNFALIARDMPMTKKIEFYWFDELRWKSWGRIKTNNSLIIDSHHIRNEGVVEISRELLTNLSEDIIIVYGDSQSEQKSLARLAQGEDI